ncbi:MAG: FtsX-like permease family protein [Saprospiraceae bacterium]
MLKSYLFIPIRKIVRHKRLNLLNILGLGIGTAAVLLIYQIIRYELSFNKNFKNYDRIVRMVGERNSPESGRSFQMGIATAAMISAQRTVPQFAASTRVRLYRPTIIVPGPSGGAPLKKLELRGRDLALFAEPSWFEIFGGQPVAGEQATALTEPGNLIISRKLAETCFDHWQNATGQTLMLDNEPMTIRGVMEDVPENCDLPVRMLISYETLLANPDKYDYIENWGRNRGNDQLYALLNDRSGLAAANAAVSQVGVREYAAASNSRQIGTNRHFLQPLSDLHFDTRFGSPGGIVVDRSRLWVLSAIGFLVLLMGCFNFINLSTAQALQRAKEIGVRKTLGSTRRMLFWQFMSETGIMVLMAVVVGLILLLFAKPFIQGISNLPEDMVWYQSPVSWIFLAALILLATIMSGFYPAMILTGFKPALAIKNQLTANTGGNRMRNGLVILQFAIAQVLLVATVVAVQQMKYIQKADLGLNKDLIYLFRVANNEETQTKFATLKQRIQQLPGVSSMTMTNLPPASQGSWQTSFTVGVGKEAQPFNVSYLFGDADFQKTFGVELLAGRWYGPADTTTGYIINETLLRKVGIASPEAALGIPLKLESDPYYPILGVVRDFNSKPLQAGYEPMVIGSYRSLYTLGGVKLNPGNTASTTLAIKHVFDDLYPDQVFDARFFDEIIAQFYQAEDRFALTCKGFSVLAILIACMGLFGLAIHAAQQRTKEIGIRKVLGAQSLRLVGMMSADFLKLVLIALMVATPVAYYLMDKWLQNFVFHVRIQWWVFLITGCLSIFIAFITISFQSIRAALANPVQSLRNE